MQVLSLEQLKVRFGETNLHLCDVMLKDIVDSRRINGAVSHHMPTVSPAAATVQLFVAIVRNGS